MRHLTDILLADLRHTIADLGTNGGLVSPSIYDTAQVIRLAPPSEGIWPALDWLLAQQQPDGGWGNPAAPRARDMPTLAAILALHTYATRRTALAAVRRGLTFLARQARHWHGPLAADLTAGAELLIPRLLSEAAAVGLAIPTEPYAALIALGERRRRLIRELCPGPGTTAAHSWEAWGETPDPSLVDHYGSVGNSPAATAFWVHCATGHNGLQAPLEAARAFLSAAARVTGVDIPGVVPTCWPIPRFEQVFALQAIYLGGLLHHPALAEVVGAQLDAVAAAFTPRGIGHSDSFSPDGDDTAAALALFHATGRPVNSDTLQLFVNGDHFCAWQRELQPSVSVTAHAIHTLRLLGQPTAPYELFVVAHQQPDGRWIGDKWNNSWLYTTWRSLVALHGSEWEGTLRRAVAAIVAYQNLDGAWGTSEPNPEETAYAILALRSLGSDLHQYEGAAAALEHGDHWLRSQYRPLVQGSATCWLAKESFRPLRIARVIELTALLSGLSPAA